MRQNRTECFKEYPYQDDWNGKFYRIKKVRPILVDKPNEVVVVTVYTFFFEEKMAKITYDREVDALYIRLKQTSVTTDLVAEGIALDYDEKGQIAGVEILDAGKRLDDQAILRSDVGANASDVNVALGQHGTVALTGIQQHVLDALRRVETEKYPLGDWYLGALYAIENAYNPDRISQAANSLRELMEKLPRVVRERDVQSYKNPKTLRQKIHERFIKDKNRYKDGWKDKRIDVKLDETLNEIDRYLELNQQPTRREQIQIAIRNIDPMANQMGIEIQNRKRDEFHKLWSQLEDFTHHRSLRATDEGKYRRYVATLEQLVYDLLAPITAHDQQEIQSIMDKSDHSDTDAETLYQLISRRGANYVFFFTNVADPVWIPFLKEKGFFKNPPNTENLLDGYVRFPFWPELRYLERVCTQAQEDVLELVLQIPTVDNPNVYANILDIALKLDGERSGKLKSKMLEFAKLDTPYLPFQFPELLAHWTSEGQTIAALELARILVQFVPDPNAEEKRRRRRKLNDDHDDSTRNQFSLMMTTLRPMPRFSEIYDQILAEGIRPLAEKEPYKVARMLVDATKNMLHHELHQLDSESSETYDYTRTWCPQLDKSDNSDPEHGKSLVHALTHACEMVYEQARESVGTLDEALRNQRWYLFTRLRQHLCAKYPSEQTMERTRELILRHGDYGRWEYHFEFQRMLRIAFEHLGEELLTRDERIHIFDTILSGPPEEECREWMGEQFSSSAFENERRNFHRRQLRPFALVLFGKYARYFRQLEADKTAEKITDASYAPHKGSKGGRTKRRSPRSTKDLVSLSDKNLLAYINEWEDEHWDTSNGVTEISIEALAAAFRKVFEDSVIPNAARLSFWIKNRDNILRPIYVRTIVDAMKDHVKAGNFDKLEQWFVFCKWALTHPDPQNEELDGIGRLGDGSREQPRWHTSRRAVCDFVETCIEEDVEVPLSARENLVDLLGMLCTQYDWRLDQDRPVLLNRDDQLTEAINTTRGRALDNLVKFGYWMRRQDDKASIPELREILEKRFNTEVSYPLTLPEYAVLGMRFGPLFHLYEELAVSQKSQLFPRNDLPAWREAFGNYLRRGRPNRQIFDELRGDFEFALDHLGSQGEQKEIVRELTRKLGQHLFTYYLWDVYPLTGDPSLLERYYLKTDGERKHWATLFNYVGHSLQNTGKHLEKGLTDRIIGFFEWRLDAREPLELREIPAWLKAECLDPEWRLNALSKVLDVDGILDATGSLEEGRAEHPRTWLPLEVTRSMPALLPMHTPLVVKCFAKLTNAAPKSGRFYIPTDDAKAILKAGLEHNDERVRKNAERAKEILFKRGILKHTD